MKFRDQSEQFLKTAQTRKCKPISPSTARKYEFSLAHALALFGDRDLAEIKNSTLKTLVSKLSADGLSASTITGVVTVVKLVVASAVNEEGEELYPRDWNHEFMDLPVIDPNDQKAPVASAKVVSQAISRAAGQEGALYALLAGSGLRIDEARVLRVGPETPDASTWDPATATIYIRATATWTPKTDAGVRDIDLAPELNDYLVETLTPVEGQPVFRHVRPMTAYDHLKEVGIPGFHSLRRFRATHLRKTAVREGLLKFWLGHTNESVTDRYDKIRVDVGARKTFAKQAGLGFEL